MKKTLIFIFLISLIVFFIIKNKNDKNQRLKNNGVYTTGKIVGITKVFKSGVFLDFEFKDLNGKIIDGSELSQFSNHTIFIGKHFPVIYNSDTPADYQILMTSEQFKEFNIPYPDSLKWVDKYVI